MPHALHGMLEPKHLVIDDSDGILKQSEVDGRRTVSTTPDGDEMKWSIAIAEGLPSDYLALEIQTMAFMKPNIEVQIPST